MNNIKSLPLDKAEWKTSLESYQNEVPHLGKFTLRPFDLAQDIAWLHEWVNLPYAVYWQLQQTSVTEVYNTYREIDSSPHVCVCVGELNGLTKFLVEFYHASEDRVAAHFDAKEGDYGFHILIGPPDQPQPQFTWHVFRTIMDFLFANPEVDRLVVEPDINNDKIHKLNKRAGFQYDKKITFPEKTAYLAFCTRQDYRIACQHSGTTNQ
ncbi:GNAT family N-acetyltransferase [Limibacter armeniacum]|uniref:GNAT family N-acetyltransferase n=1 Tax=Limibacter armeniacum TaxID=466084 RepID=UPI002FE53CDE